MKTFFRILSVVALLHSVHATACSNHPKGQREEEVVSEPQANVPTTDAAEQNFSSVSQIPPEAKDSDTNRSVSETEIKLPF